MNLIGHFHTFRPYTSRMYILHMECGPTVEATVRMHVAIHEGSNATRYLSTIPWSYVVNDEHFIAKARSSSEIDELKKLGFK